MTDRAETVPTLEELRVAVSVLRRVAFTPDFPGAAGQDDPQRVLIEAQRNLLAFVQHAYGDANWQKAVDTWGSPALEQENTRLAAENATLRAQVASLEREIEQGNGPWE